MNKPPLPLSSVLALDNSNPAYVSRLQKPRHPGWNVEKTNSCGRCGFSVPSRGLTAGLVLNEDSCGLVASLHLRNKVSLKYTVMVKSGQ
jgi:hypothetical protein